MKTFVKICIAGLSAFSPLALVAVTARNLEPNEGGVGAVFTILAIFGMLVILIVGTIVGFVTRKRPYGKGWSTKGFVITAAAVCLLLLKLWSTAS